MNDPIESGEVAVVAYHDHCIDGYTAAWVTDRALKEKGYDTILVPMEYKEASIGLLDLVISENPDITVVYFVDFSVEMGVLAELTGMIGVKVVVIDHHKTAFERYAPEITVIPTSFFSSKVNGADISLDNNESGASLCWKYFYPDCVPPNLISYVKDYDLWRYEFGEQTKWVNKYLKAQPFSLATWDRISAMMELVKGSTEILDKGRKLQAVHDKTVQEIANQARVVVLDDWPVFCVECPYEMVSDVGHTLAKLSESFSLMYTVEPDGVSIKYSLRSVEDFDVSVIAKKHGGGGHKNAAGFMTHTLAEAKAILGELI